MSVTLAGTAKLVRPRQLENAPSPIVVRLAGRDRLIRLLQS